jgi:hypothetical protein
VSVQLSSDHVSAASDRDEAVTLTIYNEERVVETFGVEVVAPRWATVAPAHVELHPGESEEVTVTFRPPRSSDVSGDVPFAVRVTPGSPPRPDEAQTEEGLVSVAAFDELTADIQPQIRRNARRSRYRVWIDNRGNTPVAVDLRATAPDDEVSFLFKPSKVTCEPGAATEVALTVLPDKRPFGSAVKHHPFDVLAESEGREPVTVSGAMFQKPLNVAAVAKWALVAAVLVIGLAILYGTVLRPVVRSNARDAVAAPLSRTNGQVNEIGAAVNQTVDNVNQINRAVGQTNGAVNDIGASVGKSPALPTSGEAAGPPQKLPDLIEAAPVSTLPVERPTASGSGSGAAAPTSVPGTPFDRRLQVNGAGPLTTSFDVPANRALLLTDLVFQNPAGDAGTISLLRGNDVLFVEALANFRSEDYHFLTAVVFDERSKVTLRVDCQNAPGKACTAAAYLSGLMRAK